MDAIRSGFNIDPDQAVTELESLCPNCHNQGITRLLMCEIPFFREIVLMSFSCEHCGYSNNDIQSAATLAEQGKRITLVVQDPSQLNRQIIKSEWASISVPEINLEIPPQTQKGSLNTLEGVLKKARDDLAVLQPERRQSDPISAQKIDQFLLSLDQLLLVQSPYHVVIDDPSGNSWMSTLHTTMEQDTDLQVVNYNRSKEQMIAMGYVNEEEQLESQMENMNLEEHISAHNIDLSQPIDEFSLSESPAELATPCFACMRDGKMKICVVNIPHFKETVVMAFSCDYCGATSNEVKGGGEISPMARRLTLRVETPLDFGRSVIKSDSAVVRVPELELELSEGTLGSMITTVEGVMAKIHENISANLRNMMGDSTDPQTTANAHAFFEKLTRLSQSTDEPYTLIIDDPLSNSFIGPIGDDEFDGRLVSEDYYRTSEQNEALGISDLNLEGYEG